MREIDAATARTWFENGEAELVDVREPAEFASRHIAGARSLPLARLGEARLAPPAGKKLVVVCASGRRSSMACERLAADRVEAYSIAGGLSGWEAAGGTIAKGARSVLPIERQVLAIAGGLVLLGVLLAGAVHPGFLALAAFVGAGLMVAGLTGFCGMALLLARAPWNQRA